MATLTGGLFYCRGGFTMANEYQLLQLARALQRRRQVLGLRQVDTSDMQQRPAKVIITDHNWRKGLPVSVRANDTRIKDITRESAELEAHALKIMRGLK
jgi:hypothetical protein